MTTPANWKLFVIAYGGTGKTVATRAAWQQEVHRLIVEWGYTFEEIMKSPMFGDDAFYAARPDVETSFTVDPSSPEHYAGAPTIKDWAEQNGIDLNDPIFAGFAPHPNILAWRVMVEEEVARLQSDADQGGKTIFAEEALQRAGVLLDNIFHEIAVTRAWKHDPNIQVYFHAFDTLSSDPTQRYIVITRRVKK